jgi:hypothetical protein
LPPEQLGIAYQALRSAVQGLLPTLKEIGIGLQVVEKSQETSPEIDLESETTPLEIPEEIETLFDPSTIEAIKPEEVDAFWDQLLENGIQEGMLNADAISYEQARQLGLTPDEDPNENGE